ncbi:hypothetical protein [Pontiella sulfatireligans]|uniref:Uncharacterized protein n=1 Tax=Pontiella sulfatireligans TaxID=2750658 RepID=A0A6C2URW0_9BACT|nr:hypothetical protein [Pontiella sulfatireligans]VGO21994.1 hypothetical protein SCARR_04074 [Pontiella sulfatireligans]
MEAKTTMMLAIALGGLLFSTQADLAHRYTFNGDFNDSVGSINGVPTLDNGSFNTEAPDLVSATPDSLADGAPTGSA